MLAPDAPWEDDELDKVWKAPCPSCRMLNMNVDDITRVHPSFQDFDGAVASSSDEDKINKLEEELKNLKIPLKSKEDEVTQAKLGKDGSRILANKCFDDSSCFNCESAAHFSRECKLAAFIRNTDETGSTIYEEITKYFYLLKVPGRPAGNIVSFFEDKIRVPLDRQGIQLAFAFYYFDDGCWNCGSPFHHRTDCKNTTHPTLHNIAKLMQEVNHPPTPQEQMKRHERKLRYAP